jgi:hypothetical protein
VGECDFDGQEEVRINDLRIATDLRCKAGRYEIQTLVLRNNKEYAFSAFHKIFINDRNHIRIES